MADNTVLNAGVGGDTFRSEDRTTFKTPVSLIDVGGTAAESLIGDAGVAMPVKGLGTAGTANTGVVTVQGIASMTPLQIADNGGTLTTDWNGTAPPIGAGVEATALRVTIATDSTGVLSIDDNGGTITVDASVGTPVFVRLSDGTNPLATLPVSIAGTVTISGVVDTELPAAAVLADNTANPTVPGVGAFVMMWDGAAWDRLVGNTVDGLLVNLGANNDVTIGAALPTGANTIGDVTISGNALTSLQLIDDVIFTDDTAFTPASGKVTATGLLFNNAVVDTVNEGDIGIQRMSTNRCAYTTIRDSAGNERGVNVTASSELLVNASQSGTWDVATVSTVATVTAVTAVSTVTTVTTVATVTNLAQLGGTAIAMNTGTRSAGTQRVTIATDDVVPVSQSGTWTVQPGNIANTTAWLVTDQAVTSGGYSVSSFLSTAAVQATAIKASPGQVYSMEFFNISATPVFVRLYNQTGAPAAGDNANIIWRGIIPGNTAGTGFVKSWEKGLLFSTGIGMRVTGAVADTDNTALAANVIVGNVDFK